MTFFTNSDFNAFVFGGQPYNSNDANKINAYKQVLDKFKNLVSEVLKNLPHISADPVSNRVNTSPGQHVTQTKFITYKWCKFYIEGYQGSFNKNGQRKLQNVFGLSISRNGVALSIDNYALGGTSANAIHPQNLDINLDLDGLVNEVSSYIIHHFDEYIENGANLNIKECISLMDIIKMKKTVCDNYNLILTGAPGTGKTYLAHEITAVMLGSTTWKDVENDTNLSSHVGFVQFHPSYDYTDFVEGLRPTTQGNQPFELLPGIFKKFCEEALKKGYKNDGNGKYETSDEGELVAVDNAKPYIFIIDEINRGEISKIFGELFFSIDPGYRGKKGKVQTQYANMEKSGNEFDKALANDKNGQFFVPKNVYIIGTMNDIDRSVESMDFAMRRRFKFVEILASKQDGMLQNKFGNDADKVIRRMNNLNLAIQETEGLGSEYHIGPSYFLKLEQPIDRNSFERLWNGYLEGIIFEYLRGREDTNEALERIKNVYLTDKTEFFDLEPKSGKLSVKNSSDWSKVFNND